MPPSRPSTCAAAAKRPAGAAAGKRRPPGATRRPCSRTSSSWPIATALRSALRCASTWPPRMPSSARSAAAGTTSSSWASTAAPARPSSSATSPPRCSSRRSARCCSCRREQGVRTDEHHLPSVAEVSGPASPLTVSQRARRSCSEEYVQFQRAGTGQIGGGLDRSGAGIDLQFHQRAGLDLQHAPDAEAEIAAAAELHLACRQGELRLAEDFELQRPDQLEGRDL